MSNSLYTLIQNTQYRIQQEHRFIQQESLREIGFLQNATMQNVSMFIATAGKRYGRLLMQLEIEIDIAINSNSKAYVESINAWRKRCLREIELCQSEGHRLRIDIERLRGAPRYGPFMHFGHFLGLLTKSDIAFARMKRDLLKQKEELGYRESYWQAQFGRAETFRTTLESITEYRSRLSEIVSNLQRETQAMIIKEFMLKFPTRGDPGSIQSNAH